MSVVRSAARARHHRRAGITLTEILISIMIMGIGLVSLAVLFPVGLARIREAARNNRSALHSSTAASELQARDLLSRSRFLSTPYYYHPVNTGYRLGLGAGPFFADPWVQDTPLPVYNQQLNVLDPTAGGVLAGRGADGLFREAGPNVPRPLQKDGPGLPVAYDPLWRAYTQFVPFRNYPDNGQLNYGQDGRFGFGLAGQFSSQANDLRDNPFDNRSPSAWGLQRVTNFPLDGSQDDLIARIFVSTDDIVLQTEGSSTSTQTSTGSPVLPDLSNTTIGPLTSDGSLLDWAYSWMFTGQRTDARNASLYQGDIVLFNKRPFAFNPATGLAEGERVLEAVFAYSTTIETNPLDENYGYSKGDPRLVLLRWPSRRPDPEVRVGSWIADITYERFYALNEQRFNSATPLDPVGMSGPRLNTLYPGQRCYWYRVTKINPPWIPATPFFAGDPEEYRQMVVEVDRPVRAKTLLLGQGPGGRPSPLHLNVALVSPYVVNVYSKTFVTTDK